MIGLSETWIEKRGRKHSKRIERIYSNGKKGEEKE